MLDWLEEGIRWLIWGLTSALLTLMDIANDILVKVASIDFANTQDLWAVWSRFLMALGAIIVWRMLIIYVKFLTNDEFQEKISGGLILKKLFIIAIIAALAPTFIKYAAQVSIWGIEEVNYFIGGSSDSTPSTTIISAYTNEKNGHWDESGSGEWIAEGQVTYTIDDIDINAKDPADKDSFKFFPTIGNIFIMGIISGVASILLLLIAFQVAQRTYAIAIKIAIGVYPISSIIDPDSDAFGTWVKMLSSDLIMNFIQVFIVMFVVKFSSSSIVTRFGIWAQIISMLGGFFLCLRGVPEFSKLFGGDSSSGGVLQQLSYFRQSTRGLGQGLKNAAHTIGDKVGGAAALPAYGIGRAAGGISRDEFAKQQQSQDRLSKGFTSNNAHPEQNTRGTSNSSQRQGDQNSQVHQNEKQDVRSNQQSDQSSNLTSNAQNAEANQGFGTQSDSSPQSLSSSQDVNQGFGNQGIGTQEPSGSFAQSKDTPLGDDQGLGNQGDVNKANSHFQQNGFESNYDPNVKGFNLTQAGSKADSFANMANQKGIKYVPARIVSNVGGNMYKRSMDRMNQRKPSVVARNAQRGNTGGEPHE